MLLWNQLISSDWQGVTTTVMLLAGAVVPAALLVPLLLAEGKTTREVAAALFLSPKTVEYHLRKVYTKLGIRSRTELVAALPR